MELFGMNILQII